MYLRSVDNLALSTVLNVAPNHTVNRVMRTEKFDNGSFWLLVDCSVCATLGLSS